mgnify:CR=1 FL=1
MSRRLKIGIIGCANIAERYMIKAINENDKYELMVIVSSNSHKAQKFGNRFNVETQIGYEKIFDYNLDAIYIPLPNSLHYSWSAECLKNNINIIVEKSLGLDFEETNKLCELAKKKDLAVLESFQCPGS